MNEGPGATPPRWGRWLLRFGAAFFVLNALLTFENLAPGAGVQMGARLSFELCLGVLGLILFIGWRGHPSARLVSLLAVPFCALVLVRYLDVTVLALFGRPLNLYWDTRHAWELARLAAGTLPAWQIAAGLLAALLLPLLLYRIVLWGTDSLASSLVWHRPRPWLLAAGGALTMSFAVHPYVHRDTRWFFALPVSPTLWHQALLLPEVLSPRAEAKLPPGPAFDGNLAALHGADVLLIFAESYGVTAFDRPQQARALASAREQLQQALLAGGRQVVSARVRSPTFGGASWLAHAALLSGLDTHDPGLHELLLTTQRPTLVRHFARHGYRTVGWMPGLQRPWPEGAFYGFDRLADLQGTGWHGPDFGYWRLPDQASMALLQQQELGGESAKRAPRFIVFPTLSSHAPFRPLAPYHADWDGLLTSTAYGQDEVAAAARQPVSWLAPEQAYLQSIDYTYQWLGGYLRERAPPGLLTIVIGDHQPLAAVSGPAASWDVPVHLISSDAALLKRFEQAGFVEGLVPPKQALGGMHQLTGVMLSAFGAAGATP